MTKIEKDEIWSGRVSGQNKNTTCFCYFLSFFAKLVQHFANVLQFLVIVLLCLVCLIQIDYNRLPLSPIN